MKANSEVLFELRHLRALLARYREDGCEDSGIYDMLGGAQQALLWVSGEGMSPSELEATIHSVPEDIDHG